jgi:hypothetical protein
MDGIGRSIGSRHFHRIVVAALTACVASACASAGGGGAAGEGTANQTQTPGPNVAWPIQTRQHIDLWLHGFALLTDDTSRVPFFRRDYRDNMHMRRNQANVRTALDANAASLSARIRTNPSYVNAQFIPLYFNSWDDLSTAAQYFIEANGDPNRARDQQIQNIIATFAGYFPTAADREWFRTFVSALEDERTRFYDGYWTQEQRDRGAVVEAVDTTWQRTYYPKFRRFLQGSQQSNGRMILSLPIGGEGRTVGSGPLSVGARATTVVVTYPERPTDALEPVYVLAHEIVGTIMSGVVNDNTSPAEKRDGIADRYAASGLVRGGHLLLRRIAPELAAGYARYYLRVANAPAGADPEASLATAFPLPENFISGFNRQLDIVLGGI